MLQPYSHEKFDDVTQIFHIELIRRETQAALQADVALRLISEDRFLEILPDDQQRSRLHTNFTDLTLALEELVNYTRGSYFRCQNSEDFFPYDEKMWDVFFAEIASAISLRIGDILTKVEQLDLPEFLSPSDARLAHWIEKITETNSVIRQHLAEVEMFLDTDHVDSWMRKFL